MKNVAPYSIEGKINFWKNLASSRVEPHNNRGDDEAANRTKSSRLKVRTPKTWPPPAWYHCDKSFNTQGAESQKSEDIGSMELQGEECHRGAINFYIGDHPPNDAGVD